MSNLMPIVNCFSSCNKDIPTLPADHPRGPASSKLNNTGMKFERGDLSVEKKCLSAIALGHRCNQCFTVCGFPPQLEHLGSTVEAKVIGFSPEEGFD